MGYLINGQVYRKVRWTGHAYEVVQDSALSAGEVLRRLLLGSEALVNGPHAGAAESAVSISPVDDDLS